MRVLFCLLIVVSLSIACNKEPVNIEFAAREILSCEELKSTVDTARFNLGQPSFTKFEVPLDSVVRYLTDSTWTWADSNILSFKFETDVNLNRDRWIFLIADHQEYPLTEDYQDIGLLIATKFKVSEQLTFLDENNFELSINDCNLSYYTDESSIISPYYRFSYVQQHPFFSNLKKSETEMQFKSWTCPLQSINCIDVLPARVKSVTTLEIDPWMRTKINRFGTKRQNEVFQELLRSVNIYVITK